MGREKKGQWTAKYVMMYLQAGYDIRTIYENEKVTDWSVRKVHLAKLGLVLYSYHEDNKESVCLKMDQNIFPDEDTYELFKKGGCFFVMSGKFYNETLKGEYADWVTSVQKYLPRFEFDTSTIEKKLISN